MNSAVEVKARKGEYISDLVEVSKQHFTSLYPELADLNEHGTGVPRAEILLAGNLNRELKSWLGIYPKRFSYCDFCLNVVPGWKQ